MSHLSISLLGGFHVIHNGSAIQAFRSDYNRALFTYLAVESDHPHRREKIANLFWPDESRHTALRNLRQTLYRINQAITEIDGNPQHIIASNVDIQFNCEADYWLDVAEFCSCIDSFQKHHHQGGILCDACLQKLEHAHNLYRGEFLDGFTLMSRTEFEVWLKAKQEECHWRELEILALLGSYWEKHGNFGQAAYYAQKEIDLEPWNESAHRRRMRAFAHRDQRGAAIKQFELLCKILSSEFAEKPSSKTVLLYELIRNGSLRD